MLPLSIAEVTLLQRLPRQHHIFDYSIPANLLRQINIGDLVAVSFRQKNTFGIVTQLKSESLFSKKIKNLNELSSKNFVTSTQLKLSYKIACHYGISWGATLSMFIPQLPNKNFIPKLNNFKIPKTKNNKPLIIPVANKSERVQTTLSLIKKVLARKQQLLLLVPEINLIDEWQKILQPLYSTTTYSANLSTVHKRKNWLAANSPKTQIIIGTRASLFLPFINLGGIVVDCAENENYKQYDQNPRYDAREVVSWLAEFCSASLAFISSAPLLEHWYQANYLHTSTWYRSNNKGHAKLNVINMINDRRGGNKKIISESLQSQINQTLTKGSKVFLYYNRLGNATTVLCQDCGFKSSCTICQRNLVWLSNNNQLACYHCNKKYPIPLPCPKCHGLNIKYLGGGLNKLKQEIEQLWPNINILTLAGDISTQQIKDLNKYEIVIGTKAALTYLDFSQINLVSMIAPDTELTLPEFRANEDAWSTARYFFTSGIKNLTIQTYQPTYYIWQSLIKNDINYFYEHELETRKKYNYPPHKSLIKFITQSTISNSALKISLDLKKIILPKLTSSCELIGPYPDYYTQIRGRYRFHLLLRYSSKSFDPETLWPILPDDIIIDRHPWNILS